MRRAGEDQHDPVRQAPDDDQQVQPSKQSRRTSVLASRSAVPTEERAAVESAFDLNKQKICMCAHKRVLHSYYGRFRCLATVKNASCRCPEFREEKNAD